MTLAAIVPDAIWISSRPVWFSGVRLRVHTTIVRLEDGGLLIHSPAPPSEEMIGELRALGPLRWLVVPNCFTTSGRPPRPPLFRTRESWRRRRRRRRTPR